MHGVAGKASSTYRRDGSGHVSQAGEGEVEGALGGVETPQFCWAAKRFSLDRSVAILYITL